MNRRTLKKNILPIAILITTILISFVYFMKPDIVFNRDGTLKRFGLGNNSKTVLPMWFVVFIVSVMVYMALRFYLVAHRL